MASPSPFGLAALKSELQSDPASLGYAAPLAAGNHTAVAALINAIGTAYAVYLPIDGDELLTWATANAVLTNFDAAAAATGVYAAGQPRAISAAGQNAARGVQLLLSGSYIQPTAGTLDITDARIAGLLSTGDPYTPGSVSGSVTLATPGLMDALVSAAVLVDSTGASLKDSLMAYGKAACSRATYRWAYNATTNPSGPHGAFAVTTDMIAEAMRS